MLDEARRVNARLGSRTLGQVIGQAEEVKKTRYPEADVTPDLANGQRALSQGEDYCLLQSSISFARLTNPPKCGPVSRKLIRD